MPEFNQQGGTLVVPGHGRLSDEADVADYRDMVTIVRDRVRDLVKKGMTLEQVKAAKPTFDYDGIYGADKGAVFVEQVYRSLTGQAMRRRPTPNPLLRTLFAVALAIVPCVWRPGRAGGQGRQGGPPPTARVGGAGRSDRPVGLGRDRRLALAHGHAAQGRLRQRAAERRGPQGCRRLGSRTPTTPPAISAGPLAPPALMRMPMRVRISWQDDNTLKLEIGRRPADAGLPVRDARAVGHGDADRRAAAGRAHVAGRVGSAVVPAAAIARAGVRRPGPAAGRQPARR